MSFDFIVDPGDALLTEADLKSESERLIRYFLSTLTLAADELWVNLSPNEGHRIIPDELARTEMGRDLLAQDYLLKQLTASLMYPEGEVGRRFWTRVHTLAQERFGEVEWPANAFNKVWIVPQYARVAVDGDTVYVVDGHLKVMLEEDYLKLEGNSAEQAGDDEILKPISKTLIRDILIPEIEREINTGKNFAPLRQIFHSMILATWYKSNLRESVVNHLYADKQMVAGIDPVDLKLREQIYQRYLSAFKRGVFNYVKEDLHPHTQEPIPRQYFSGGITTLDPAAIQPASTDEIDSTVLSRALVIKTDLSPVFDNGQDRAMLGDFRFKTHQLLLSIITSGVLLMPADLDAQSFKDKVPSFSAYQPVGDTVKIRQLREFFAGPWNQILPAAISQPDQYTAISAQVLSAARRLDPRLAEILSVAVDENLNFSNIIDRAEVDRVWASYNRDYFIPNGLYAEIQIAENADGSQQLFGLFVHAIQRQAPIDIVGRPGQMIMVERVDIFRGRQPLAAQAPRGLDVIAVWPSVFDSRVQSLQLIQRGASVQNSPAELTDWIRSYFKGMDAEQIREILIIESQRHEYAHKIDDTFGVTTEVTDRFGLTDAEWNALSRGAREEVKTEIFADLVAMIQADDARLFAVSNIDVLLDPQPGRYAYASRFILQNLLGKPRSAWTSFDDRAGIQQDIRRIMADPELSKKAADLLVATFPAFRFDYVDRAMSSASVREAVRQFAGTDWRQILQRQFVDDERRDTPGWSRAVFGVIEAAGVDFDQLREQYAGMGDLLSNPDTSLSYLTAAYLNEILNREIFIPNGIISLFVRAETGEAVNTVYAIDESEIVEVSGAQGRYRVPLVNAEPLRGDPSAFRGFFTNFRLLSFGSGQAQALQLMQDYADLIQRLHDKHQGSMVRESYSREFTPTSADDPATARSKRMSLAELVAFESQIQESLQTEAGRAQLMDAIKRDSNFHEAIHWYVHETTAETQLDLLDRLEAQIWQDPPTRQEAVDELISRLERMINARLNVETGELARRIDQAEDLTEVRRLAHVADELLVDLMVLRQTSIPFIHLLYNIRSAIQDQAASGWDQVYQDADAVIVDYFTARARSILESQGQEVTAENMYAYVIQHPELARQWAGDLLAREFLPDVFDGIKVNYLAGQLTAPQQVDPAMAAQQLSETARPSAWMDLDDDVIRTGIDQAMLSDDKSGIARIEQSVVVESDLARVFQAITDPAEVIKWGEGVEGLLEDDGTYPTVGRTYRWRYRLFGIPMTLTDTFTQIDLAGGFVSENRMYLPGMKRPFLEWDEIYVLTQDGPNVVIQNRINMTFRLKGIAPLLNRFLVQGIAQSQVQDSLAALSEHLTSGDAAQLSDVVTEEVIDVLSGISLPTFAVEREAVREQALIPSDDGLLLSDTTELSVISAGIENPGGIDMNPVNMTLDVTGQAIVVDWSYHDVFSVEPIKGLRPVIIQMSPLVPIPLNLGRADMSDKTIHSVSPPLSHRHL